MYRFIHKKQYMNLLYSMKDGKHKIKEISKRSNMSSGHLGIVLDQLVREGIIEKIKYNQGFFIQLTDRGRAVVLCHTVLQRIIECKETALSEAMKFAVKVFKKRIEVN